MKSYPKGTKFRWLPLGVTWELLQDYDEKLQTVDCLYYYQDGVAHKDWLLTTDSIFSYGMDQVEIMYPKTGNFNSLYAKLTDSN